MLLLVGCTSDQPAKMSPVASTQEFKIDTTPLAVYTRIYTRMNLCHAVHNVFYPGDIVGVMEQDGKRGHIYFARNGLALWGADIEEVENGSRVITRVGQDAASERYHALIRIWVEAKKRPVSGETDC